MLEWSVPYGSNDIIKMPSHNLHNVVFRWRRWSGQLGKITEHAQIKI